ncbi:MAG: sialidase family protein [Kiritimatiellae bacterium]|nr:sialidase family protein [Kiritimatiellia bacterium]MDD5522608.1 sialidase family protein [Kiritimatiellia bacterium]
MRTILWTLILLCACCLSVARADDVKWLVTYRGDALPGKEWTQEGGPSVQVEVVDGALCIADASDQDMRCYRATWEASPDSEIVVEARVRVKSLSGYKHGGKGKGISSLNCPWVSGSPIGILVSNGQRQEGLLLCEKYIATFVDRFYQMNTTDKFHDYRLVIRGNDMSVSVDGELRIRGENAFWKPAEGKPFIQFGSNSKGFLGEAFYESVRLGVRPATAGTKKGIKITLSEPWQIPKPAKISQTRPYLYNVGEGVLLMSVAQGPDKHYEPYGILKSTDEGKTWSPVEGLQEKTFAPQPMIRLTDGRILGVSRWNMKYEDYVGKVHYIGMSYLFDRMANSFVMFENKITVPKDTHEIMVFDRHIFAMPDGSILAVVYDGRKNSYLLKTIDQGKTWTHFSTIGKGHEPGVVRISETEWTALLRQGGTTPLLQVWSHDGGKTWSPPAVLEEGSVDADVVCMNNGVLACSYGRPGCNLMFSTDQGKTWGYHQTITDRSGFNYTTLHEVRPGRLLYVHDAPPLTALYVDVERIQ